jgi:hypothetical protein
MTRFISLCSLILISGIILSCCSAKKAVNMKTDRNAYTSGPKAIIYQTKEDYSKFVPIILSDDKKSIESYPDIKDIYFNGSLAYPTQLHKNYWLDNRGIGINVAFINLTYDEYSKLPKTPSHDELIKMVIDAEPIVRMYSCGIRSSFQDIVAELNKKIDDDNLSSFIKIK